MKIEKSLSFKETEYRERLSAVKSRMTDNNIDALIVTSPENICYVSGYRTVGYYYTQALLVTLDQDPILIMRLFESRNADAFSWIGRSQCRPYTDIEDPIEVITDALTQLRVAGGTLGVEKRYLSFLPIGQYEKLQSLLPRATFVDGCGVVEGCRRIKSPAEVAYIRNSCRISEAGLDAARNNCQAGVTENQLSAHVHMAMIRLGCEYPGLPLFLGSGHRTQIPHVQWTDKRIEVGDNVPLELTGVTHRYAGPLFRTFVVGKAQKKMKENFEVVKDQLEAAIDAIRPGVTAHEVDAAAKKVAKRCNRLSSFTKRTGYSIGLNYPPDWGEGHFLDIKEKDDTVLEAGMTFHLPMSLRADGELAVAVSESVLVTNSGVEVLTNYQRSLLEV